MNSTIALSILAVIATGAGLVIMIRRIASPGVTLPATSDWIDELSIERYRPMLRLLDDGELRSLCSQYGITPRVAAELRRQRRQIFRGYLRGLAVDFNRVCMALKLLMLQASTDRPDLASALIRSQVAFNCGVVLVQARLVLHTCGIGTADITSLLKLFDGMRIELRTLLPAAMPSEA